MTTTFLILSDTHDDAFPDPASLHRADVVLHCGDLTMIGGLTNYKKAIANIKALDAELKLVIAGMSPIAAA
jgi:predicted phosphodiesterase